MTLNIVSGLIAPSVHLNGTSHEELTRQFEEAYRALDEALDKLHNAAPNARDYYVQGADAFGRAVDEYESRLRRLRSVKEELEVLILHLFDGGNR